MKTVNLITARREPLRKHLNPVGLVTSLWSHRSLIRQLTRREIQARYKGSFLGSLWSILLPIGMLLVYTFVFSVILQARWATDGNESTADFALTLFAGLIMFNFFADLVSDSPNLIAANVSYVKKVVFPLEILPVVILGAALFRWSMNFAILVVASLLIRGALPLTILLVPLLLIPLIALSQGMSWFLSALGVYVRDIGQAMNLIVRVMFFMTPIFYRPSMVPEKLRWITTINPMAFIVENTRRTLIRGEGLNWLPFLAVTALSLVVMQLGYAWFHETRRGFSDVL